MELRSFRVLHCLDSSLYKRICIKDPALHSTSPLFHALFNQNALIMNTLAGTILYYLATWVTSFVLGGNISKRAFLQVLNEEAKEEYRYHTMTGIRGLVRGSTAPPAPSEPVAVSFCGGLGRYESYP